MRMCSFCKTDLERRAGRFYATSTKTGKVAYLCAHCKHKIPAAVELPFETLAMIQRREDEEAEIEKERIEEEERLAERVERAVGVHAHRAQRVRVARVDRVRLVDQEVGDVAVRHRRPVVVAQPPPKGQLLRGQVSAPRAEAELLRDALAHLHHLRAQRARARGWVSSREERDAARARPSARS